MEKAEKMEMLQKLVSRNYSPERTLEVIKEIFNSEDIDRIFVEIISKYYLSREDIKKLWDRIKVHGSYESVIKSYLLYREEKNFGSFYTTLMSLYQKKLSCEQLELLMRRIKQLSYKTLVDVDDAVHFLSVTMGEQKIAPKPEWVDIREGENLSLLTSVSPGGAISEKRYKDLVDESTSIFSSFEGENIVNEKISMDIRKTVQNYLSTVSSLEGGEKMANRVFGPQNRFEDKECPYNLNEIGPCRMLNCYCRGGGDITPDVDSGINWFDGVCDICNTKILNKSHAVRYPHKCGGWSGVYCSFNCLKESEFFETEEDIDQLVRIENLKITLDRYGIMDRTAV